MSKPSTLEHLKSLLVSIFSLVRSPESVPGYILETVSEWNRSRNWRLMWVTIPILLVNLGFWVTAGFYMFRSTSSIVQASMTQVSKRYSLEELQRVAFEEHYMRNRVKERHDSNANTDDTSKDEGYSKRQKLVVDEEFIKSDRFLESEVFLNRAFGVSPDSVQANYQLALLSSLNTRLPDPEKTASELMEKLAKNEADPFPPAHAWMATSLVGSEQQLNPTDIIQLEKYLKVASQWKLIEPGLLSIYSSICVHSGRLEKALAIAKLAAESRPELNLEYAQLLKMGGIQYETEFNRATKAAEKAFIAKIGKPNQTDTDRLGLAKILLMQDQRDKAVEILEQGITDDPKLHQPIRHGLAELHIEKFRTDNEVQIRLAIEGSSNRESNDGTGDETGASSQDESKPIDWSNLQAAAKLDRENPIVGQEIAMQWRRLTMPPADLLEVLRYQLVNDLATTGARLMIAELYLIKGRVEEAKKEWETILKKEPNVIPALNNLSVILSRETPPKLSLAIEYIERANRMKPMDAEICDTFGEVLMNAGRPIEAIAKLEESLRIDPRRISTRIKLSNCYREIGMNDMAGEQIVQIKRLEDEKHRTNNTKNPSIDKDELAQPAPKAPSKGNEAKPKP